MKGYYFPLSGAGSEIAYIPIDVTSVVRPNYLTTIVAGLQVNYVKRSSFEFLN